MPYGTTRNFHRLLILFSSLSILTVLSSGVFYLFYRVVLACCLFKVVAPLRDQSLFWHNLWTDCGRPHQGLVADIMRKTRARYHRAVRYVKKNKDDIVNKRIAEALSENRSRDFWGEIKRIRQKTAASSGSVDGFSNSSDIADSFADKFHELYTTVDYDKDELLVFLFYNF